MQGTEDSIGSEVVSAALVEAVRVLRWQHFRNPHPRPSSLDLTLAADEVLAWLGDVRRFDPRNHRAGWASVLAELESALDSIGPHLSEALALELQQVREEVARGYVDVAAERRVLRDRLTNLLRRLGEKATLYATWLDFFALVSDPETSAEECIAARAFFWNVAEAGGRNRDRLSNELHGVLMNDGRAIQRTQVELGDIVETDEGVGDRRMSLSVADRLCLVQKILLSTPQEHHHVVWHVFTRATIDGQELRLGNLTVYSGPWFLEVARAEPTPSWVSLPAELHDRLMTSDDVLVPDDEPFVFTRLDLGRQSLSNAPEVAAEIVDAMVTLAKHRSGRRNNWTRLQGHWHAIDGRMAGASIGFHEPATHVDVAPYLDAVSDELEAVHAISDATRFRSGEVREWSEALRWWREASYGHDAGAVLVGVRVLDLVAARVQLPSWESYAKRHLQWGAVRSGILDSVQSSIRSGLATADGFERANPDQRDVVDELKGAIFTYNMKMIMFDYVAAIGRLEQIAELGNLGSVGARRIRTLRERLWNRDASERWIASLRDDWAVQIRRLARVRDALAHGGPTTRQSISSAALFTSSLVDTALYLAFDSALKGQHILIRHEDFREDRNRWRQRFKDGQSLVPAVFPIWNNEEA